jgi:hypothetical protein
LAAAHYVEHLLLLRQDFLQLARVMQQQVSEYGEQMRQTVLLREQHVWVQQS